MWNCQSFHIKYSIITGASSASATRDLKNLVENNIFFQKGEFKSRRYFLEKN